MKTSLYALFLATCVAVVVSDATEEGSGDGPEIVIKDADEETVVVNDGAVESVGKPTDLLDLEMNPEENEIKVNEKVVVGGSSKVNKKKCQKCLRSHYRARHDEFCTSCDEGEAQVEKEEESASPMPNKRCHKCARKNFRARNEAFCTEECSSDVTVNDKKKETKVKKKNKNNVTSEKNVSGDKVKSDESEADEVEDSGDDETTTVSLQEEADKKNKNKKKNQRLKNKDKSKKKHNKKHKNKKVDETENNVEEDKKETVKLGPLENLIRFLIKTNTYTH